MPNLPEDIVDRIRALEREVHRLTTYVNSKPGGPAAALAAPAAPVTPGSAPEGAREPGAREEPGTGTSGPTPAGAGPDAVVGPP